MRTWWIARGAAATLLLLAASCTGDTAATTQPAETAATTVVPTRSTTAPATPTTTSTSPRTTITTTPSTSTTTTSTTMPPAPFDPFGAPIVQMQQAMDEGTLTAKSLVEFYLDRIDAYDPVYRAFVTVNPDALAAARALDLERESLGPRSPLHGIPVVLKDNIDTFDMQTTAGSIALEGFVPPTDAFQADRLRQAGAIILGKVNLQEWARSIHGNSSILGRTLNPYDTGRNVGGSSAGTAAAVTTEMAAVGLGSDTCGSIRVPSAYNSLWGLRPTVGLSSRSGVIPLSATEDTVGPMARFVSDLAIVLDATTGEDPDDPATLGADENIPGTYLDSVDRNSLEGARIGVMYSLFGGVGPVYRTVESALTDMEAAGATVIAVEVPNRSGLIGGSTAIFLREWPFATIDYFTDRPNAPITSLDDVLASGEYLPETEGPLQNAVSVATLDTADYQAAVAARAQVADAVEATMDEYDLDALAYPSISNSPAAVGVRQRGNNCATASVGGLPAISMPAGLTVEGLPVGVELLGRRWSEPTLIRLASGYEAQVGPRVWPDSAPPLR